MVYESDFYTTRRPYTRPSVSTYTSTILHTMPPRYIVRRSVSPVPTYSTATYAMPRFTRATSPIHVITVPGAYHPPGIPLVAHRRITPSVVVPSRMRNASYMAEMKRISHRLRPRVGSEPCEDFLNSRPIVTFDDETRAIRARTKELLRRVNQPLPRSYYPDYQPPRMEEIEPLSHEAYIEQRVFTPMRHVHQDIDTMSRYNEPARQYIGKGHLACISFAGGRPIARRRAMPRAEEDRNVREDVKFLSYYNRARAAALGPEATLEAMKALLAPPYHRRDPQPGLVPLPSSRPRAPASFLARAAAAHYEKKSAGDRRHQKQYTPSNSKELSRLRLLAEKDAESGRVAYAEAMKATEAARQARGTDPDQEDRAARKKQREMEAEEEARRELEERRLQRDAAKRQAALEKQREQERLEEEALAAKREEEEALELELRAEREEQERQAAAERRAEEERLAEIERQEAERQAELDRQAELERQREEEESRAEAERQAELERQADAEKQAELERQEAERKAEEEKQEAARKAEEERLAEIARQEEAERQAEQARLEAEKAEAERLAAEQAAAEEAAAAAATVAETEAAPSESEPAPPAEDAPAEEVSEVPAEAAPESEAPASEETPEAPAEETSPPEETPEEESTAVVEEPQSPEQETPVTNGAEEPLTNGANHTEDGPAIEELEIPLEGESADTVVKKVQDASLSEEVEAQ